MLDILISIGLIFIGYFSGSLSFALWVTRITKGFDLRSSGSQHATTTNTIRQAGWGLGLVVFILDVGKGFVPTFLAVNYGPLPWAVPLTAAMTVVGHCWPIFAGFRGGMGLAAAGGSILVVYPWGLLIGLGIVILLALTLKHAARAGLFTGLLLAPVFWLFGRGGEVIWLATLVGMVLAVRFYSDWNREYNELWLDREKP